jgi:beta-glucanase (GH16 family)
VRTTLQFVAFLSVALCSGLASVSAQTAAPPAAVTLPPLSSDYHLVWSDDFSKDPDGFPDPTKWVFEHGFVRNNEPQYYTVKRAENARVEHGHLVLEVRKESFTPSDDVAEAYGKTWHEPKKPKVAPYTSASIATFGKASWLYGRIEIRAKMPAGLGPWPALWTLGTNITTVDWPRCGEIDLLEMQGQPFDMVWGNFHYAIDGKHVSSDHGGIKIPTSNTDFHVYTLDWTSNRIDLYADGVRYSSFDVNKANEAGQNPYRKPQYLIMNVALYGGKIDDSIFPQQMVVDYVKVYQKAPATP